MKQGIFSRAARGVLAMALWSIAALSSPGGAAGVTLPPPFPIPPLTNVQIPLPTNFTSYVKNQAAAVRLGKALFWDMQAGSDGVQACASCHFHAGADSRMRNQLNPGFDGVFFPGSGPDYTLQPADFPFHDRVNPDFQDSPVLRDNDDAVGSQGIRKGNFLGIVRGSAVDSGASVPDLVYQVNGANVRQVTGRNAPSVINAALFFNTFRDGRANNTFNGENPFGPADAQAGVWLEVNGSLVKQPVQIGFASLASQATGPPVSSVEMSFAGRTFPWLGRKMLSLVPLGSQSVHPQDSVLGPLSRGVLQANGSVAGAKGLSTSYLQMIKDAFQDPYWNSLATTPDGFSQMEANFSLFWGLAIQLYEMTLISDQTRFDRFLAGDASALTAQEQTGMGIFNSNGRCQECHAGGALSGAAFNTLFGVLPQNLEVMGYMFMGVGVAGIYDEGFYNIGVRPTVEDLGRGGTAPFMNPLTGSNFPLSYSRLGELQLLGRLPFSTPPITPPQLLPSTPVFVDGAFLTPSLRNVELTAPYFHNGEALTLEQTVDFYTRGGNFPVPNKDNLNPFISQIDAMTNSPENTAAVVAFLKSLTDERVRNESAPFDHPELLVPNGGTETTETFIRIPPIGALGLLPTGTILINGGATVAASLGVTLTLSAASSAGSITQMQFSKDGGVSYFPWEPFRTTRNVTLLPENGNKTITVRYQDSAGNLSAPVTASITLNAPLPVGTVSMNGGIATTISQSVLVALSASSAAGSVTQMQFSKDGGASYFPLEPFSLLRTVTLTPGAGLKTLTVRFKDSVGNLSAPYSASITLLPATPTGSITINGGAAQTQSLSAALTLTASSPAGLVTQMQFSKDGGVSYFPWEPFHTTRNVTLLPENGNKTMTVRYQDSAGNLSAPISAGIVLNAPLPVGTLSMNGGMATTSSQSVLVALSASSAAGSVTQMQFSKDGGASYFPLEPFALFRTVTLTPGAGPKTLTVRFKDSNGNFSVPFTAGITLLPTTPTGSVTINGGAAQTQSLRVILSLTASSVTAAVTQMQFSKDGINYFPWEPFSPTRVVTLLPGNGPKTLWARFRDAAGGISEPATASITLLDTVKPSGSVAFTTPNPTTSATGTLALTASDANGVSQMQFSKDGINYYAWEPFAPSRTVILAPGLNTITVRFQDTVGNLSDPISTSITRN